MLTACFCSGLFEQRCLAFGLLVKRLCYLLCFKVLCVVFGIQCCYAVAHIGHKRFMVLSRAFLCYFFTLLLLLPFRLEIGPLLVLPQVSELIFISHFLHPCRLTFIQLLEFR